jgi:hypothetical protein
MGWGGESNHMLISSLSTTEKTNKEGRQKRTGFDITPTRVTGEVALRDTES